MRDWTDDTDDDRRAAHLRVIQRVTDTAVVLLIVAYAALFASLLSR